MTALAGAVFYREQDEIAVARKAISDHVANCVAAERERFGKVFNMARICAETNMGRADDCGDLARKLLAALNDLKA